MVEYGMALINMWIPLYSNHNCVHNIEQSREINQKGQRIMNDLFMGCLFALIAVNNVLECVSEVVYWWLILFRKNKYNLDFNVIMTTTKVHQQRPNRTKSSIFML